MVCHRCKDEGSGTVYLIRDESMGYSDQERKLHEDCKAKFYK